MGVAFYTVKVLVYKRIYRLQYKFKLLQCDGCITMMKQYE